MLGDFVGTLGSSPLARGTYFLARRLSLFQRLIPARAGNIHEGAAGRGRGAAHPRSRGEHAGATKAEAQSFGSSPLARGTCGRQDYCRGLARLIPARAGNILSGFTLSITRAAHPRSRGEHRGLPVSGSFTFGSSPLARGTYARSQRTHQRGRLIPARAGNILADMGVYPLHQQNRITLKPEPHPGYTINSHS